MPNQRTLFQVITRKAPTTNSKVFGPCQCISPLKSCTTTLHTLPVITHVTKRNSKITMNIPLQLTNQMVQTPLMKHQQNLRLGSMLTKVIPMMFQKHGMKQLLYLDKCLLIEPHKTLPMTSIHLVMIAMLTYSFLKWNNVVFHIPLMMKLAKTTTVNTSSSITLMQKHQSTKSLVT